MQTENIFKIFFFRVGTVPIAKILLSHGANASATDKNGQSPLHRAVDVGNLEFVDWLIKSQPMADNGVNVIDTELRSPLHLACIKGSYQDEN